MNFDAIATKYSSFISTMNAGKHGKVNFTQDVAKDPSKKGNKDRDANKKNDIVCNACGKRNHSAKDCRIKSSLKCDHCGKDGHVEKVCRSKAAGVSSEEAKRKTKERHEKLEKNNKKGEANVAKESVEGQLSDAQLSSLCSKLKSGEIKLCLTVSEMARETPLPLAYSNVINAIMDPNLDGPIKDDDGTMVPAAAAAAAAAAVSKFDATSSTSSGPTTSKLTAMAWEPSIGSSTTSSGPPTSKKSRGNGNGLFAKRMALRPWQMALAL